MPEAVDRTHAPVKGDGIGVSSRADAAIEVVGMCKLFGEFAAVDGLDLSVRSGEVHGFLGPNGAGKTTTIRVLLGLYGRDAGEVRVLGQDPAIHAAAINRRVSYVPGDVALWPNLTGQEVLDALAGLRGAYDVATERRLVEEFGLNPRKKVRTYSKGNRQKVALIAAFAARTDLLVLDEPTSGLDPLMEILFQRLIREAVVEGRTVLLSSHILAEVEALCESVTIIKDGRLVQSGRLSEMRYLAASSVTAAVPEDEVTEVRDALRSCGLDLPSPDHLLDWSTTSGERRYARLEFSVPRDDVGRVLTLLIGAGARDISCIPASLEDLFLRYYQDPPQ